MPEDSMSNVSPAAINQLVEDVDKLKWQEKERCKEEKHKAIYDAGVSAGKKKCRKKLCKKKKKTCFKNNCLPSFVIWMMAGAVAGSFLCTFIYFLFHI